MKLTAKLTYIVNYREYFIQTADKGGCDVRCNSVRRRCLEGQQAISMRILMALKVLPWQRLSN